MKLEVEDKSPLKWPDDRPRIRFQDRKGQAAWKLKWNDVLVLLHRELSLVKATSAWITRNSFGHDDGGVAVWFSRGAADDYGWQDALGFIGVVPTKDQITRSYMQAAQKVHPDGPTPNNEAFLALTKHRDQALRWVRGERLAEHELCMAVDTFKEQRHNLNAIRLTLSALRQIERCGSPVMMEQAFRGFRPALAAQGVGSVSTVA